MEARVCNCVGMLTNGGACCKDVGRTNGEGYWTDRTYQPHVEMDLTLLPTNPLRELLHPEPSPEDIVCLSEDDVRRIFADELDKALKRLGLSRRIT